MKNWKNYLVPSLYALGGVGFLIPAVKSVIKGVPLTYDSLSDFDNYGSLAFAFMFFTFAVVFGRKSGGGSGPPSA